MNVVKKIGDWLKVNHILVNDDWLKACVEWIQEENQGHGLSDEDINSHVYEQWLLADLHELETSCLPAGLSTSQKYELTGAYALQIDNIVDVGISFYSQQQKLKCSEDDNVHVNAEEPTQKPWEPKPSRMMMFKLTDGSHNVQGIEYRPISCLSPKTAPGSKVLIHGRVLCRHGVLMLSENNIKFLGGEVDTLVEANTLTNVLQSAMEASEEHAAKKHRQTFAGSLVRKNKQPLTDVQANQGSQCRSRGNSSSGGRNGNRSSVRGSSDVKTFSKMKTEPMSQNIVVGNNPVNNANNQNFSDYDAFLDDDMDGLMEEMNEYDFADQHNILNRNPIHSTSDNRGVNQTTGGMQNRNGAVNSSSNLCGNVKLNNIKTSGSQINSGIHDNIDIKNSITHIRSPCELSNQMLPRSSGGHIVHNDDLVGIDFEDDMELPPMDDDFMVSPSNYTGTKNLQYSKKAVVSLLGNQNIANNIDANNHKGSNNQKVGPTLNSSSKQQSFNLNSKSCILNKDRQVNHTGRCSNINSSNSMCSLNLKTGSRPAVLSGADTTVDTSSKGVNMSITSRNPATTKTTITTPINRNSVKLLSGSLIKVKTETPMKRKLGTGLEQRSLKNQQGTIENFFTPDKIQKIKHEQSEIVHGTSDLGIQTEYPFTYLVKVMSLPAQEQSTYHTVKAYIATLTSKLSMVDGKWTLQCKINDGTMAVDVDLSNQVLTKMIGFSPKEAQEMKARVKTDSSVKEVLQEGIQQCQQKLIELMCLLELEICARNPRPLIVATKQLTSHHIDMLYNRVMASWNT